MTTATTWRKERGRETERLLAAYWRERGWPFAEPVGAGRHGADITGMPGLLPEVKATKACEPVAWLRQAVGHIVPGQVVPAHFPSVAGALAQVPFVVWRPDGMGEAHMLEWPMIIPLLHGTWLLRAAGYGDGDG